MDNLDTSSDSSSDSDTEIQIHNRSRIDRYLDFSEVSSNPVHINGLEELDSLLTEMRSRPLLKYEPTKKVSSREKRFKKATAMLKKRMRRKNKPPTKINFNNNRLVDNYVSTRMCRCITCGILFNNDVEYRSHICGSTPDAVQIPTNPFGTYVCPVCGNRYTSPNMLGEHFILEHNSYEELGSLDTSKKKLGFPGFDILEHIDMIRPVLDTNNFKETCPICSYDYKHKEEPYSVSDPGLICYNSDNELTFGDPEEEDSRDLSDSEYIINKKIKRRSIRDKKLIDKIDEIKTAEILPVKMSCCGYTMCYGCLRSSVETSDNIVCVFCKRDHSERDEEYITVVEESDVCEDKKWLPWWYKHIDIFY